MTVRRAVVLGAVVAIVFGLGFASGSAYGAEPCIRSFDVRPSSMVRMQVYDITARIRIEPHPDHRAFAFAFTSDVGVAGGSYRELNNIEGHPSEITQDPIELRGKPGGHYFFLLSIYGVGGKLLEQRTTEIRVAGEADDR